MDSTSDTQTGLTQLSYEKSHGSYGSFELEINVSATKMPDLRGKAITRAAYDARESIKAAIMEAVVANDEQAQAQRIAERQQIISLFDNRIFVEEIPNGYCSQWCCKHLPWFKVTTPVGRFTVGWRKRVIQIDWTETLGTKTSEELFASENVTKKHRLIHAWSAEDAQKYIGMILAGG